MDRDAYEVLKQIEKHQAEQARLFSIMATALENIAILIQRQQRD